MRTHVCHTSRDHPRSRGVYGLMGWAGEYRNGSSPLARGLRAVLGVEGADLGIIPARAGFTWGAGRFPRAVQDHPRSRGVYQDTSSTIRMMLGSSPLARGLQRHILPDPPIRGIIPARAGFTDRLNGAHHTRGDHPRSRGVYRSMLMRLRSRRGSSPLARGLRLYAPHTRDRAGIIPARAGFTGCEGGRNPKM